jgi:predicted LPLAT superfamily acyltransferase
MDAYAIIFWHVAALARVVGAQTERGLIKMSNAPEKEASPEAQQHWAGISEYGSVYGMRFMLAVYSLCGTTVFKICLFPVVLFYTCFHGIARSASFDYRVKMHAFNPDFPAPKFGHSFLHIWSFATALLDKMSVWMGKITRRDVVIHNGEIIDELLDSGQGAVIMISHLGNFEICQALSEDRPRLQLIALQHTKHAEKFNQLLDQHNKGTRVEFMQVTELDVGKAMILSERISQGHFVAISADRVAINNAERALTKNFLGHPAQFPTGPFVLANTLAAPVLSIQCIKQNGVYNIYFDVLRAAHKFSRKERAIATDNLLAAYVKNLEHYCLKAPWQWYNFYPFWQEQSKV